MRIIKYASTRMPANSECREVTCTSASASALPAIMCLAIRAQRTSAPHIIDLMTTLFAWKAAVHLLTRLERNA